MTLPCSLSWDEILRGKSCEKGLRLKSMSVVTMWISFVIIHNSSDRHNEHGGEWSLPARRNFILNIHYKARAMSDLNFKYYTIYTHFITIHLSVWVSSGSFNVRFKNFALLLSIRLVNVARNVFRRHSELLLRLKLKCWMFCVSVVFVAPQTRVTAGKLWETSGEVTEVLSTFKLILRALLYVVF